MCVCAQTHNTHTHTHTHTPIYNVCHPLRRRRRTGCDGGAGSRAGFRHGTRVSVAPCCPVLPQQIRRYVRRPGVVAHPLECVSEHGGVDLKHMRVYGRQQRGVTQVGQSSALATAGVACRVLSQRNNINLQARSQSNQARLLFVSSSRGARSARVYAQKCTGQGDGCTHLDPHSRACSSQRLHRRRQPAPELRARGRPPRPAPPERAESAAAPAHELANSAVVCAAAAPYLIRSSAAITMHNVISHLASAPRSAAGADTGGAGAAGRAIASPRLFTGCWQPDGWGRSTCQQL